MSEKSAFTFGCRMVAVWFLTSALRLGLQIAWATAQPLVGESVVSAIVRTHWIEVGFSVAAALLLWFLAPALYRPGDGTTAQAYISMDIGRVLLRTLGVYFMVV